MNELVERLTKGLHPIIAERCASSDELREQIERGFVLLKFSNTNGGTELGSQLDMQLTNIDNANFESGTGNVHLVGDLTLNYDKVQLIADIDLASLKGKGQLVLIDDASALQRAKASDSGANGSESTKAKGRPKTKKAIRKKASGSGANGAESAKAKGEPKTKKATRKKVARSK